MTRPEHSFQMAVMKLASDVVEAPHRIRAFDRSKDGSGVQHMNEAARGIRSGTPDTELVCGGFSVNVELKKPGTRHLKAYQPTEEQDREMARLRAAGAYAACAWSLAEVVQHWRAAGVPLRQNADLIAMDRDLKLAARALKAKARVRRAA